MSIDKALFLQRLRELSLEEGRDYLRSCCADLPDDGSVGEIIADEALAQLYHPFISLKLAELLLYFSEIRAHRPSYALGLKTKGNALRYIGHHQAAMDYLDAAAREFLNQGDEVGWARTRISWILAAAWLGRVEEALREAVQARTILLCLHANYWVCLLDHNTAVIYSQIGRYQDALDIYASMLAIYPTLTDQGESFIKRSIAMAEGNSALNLARLGRFAEAHQLQLRVLERFSALKDASQMVNAEMHLGDLDYVQGYYGSALRHYHQAQDIFDQHSLDNPRLLAELELQLARTLVKLNRATEACQLAYQAVAVYRQLDNSLQASNALREYATTLVASGRRREALEALNEALTLFERGGFELHTLTTRLQRADLLLDTGAVAQAYIEARVVKEAFAARGMSLQQAVHASLVMGAALVERARQHRSTQSQERVSSFLLEATDLCKQAALQARRQHLQEEVYRSQYLLGRIFVLQGNDVRAARHYRAAIVQVERILDDLVYDLSPAFLHSAWQVYEEMIALSLRQAAPELAFVYLERVRSMALRQYLNVAQPAAPLDPTGSATILRMRHELAIWQERYREDSLLFAHLDTSVSPTLERGVIEAELKQSEAKMSVLFERLYLQQAGPSSGPHGTHRSKRRTRALPDVAELRQRLAPDQLLLAYFLCGKRLVIFALSRERFVIYEDPDGMERLRRLLPLVYAHLQPRGWPDPQDPPQRAIRRMFNKLYHLLITPIAASLPPLAGQVTIVPYGPLHLLPFHALYTDDGHFLIEDYQVNYLPASSLLEAAVTIPEHYAEEGPRTPLILGYSGKGHIQRAVAEASALHDLLGGRCYLEEEATTARLMEQAGGSSIIHLATHGRNRLDAPNFSFILLADGQFNAIDAFSLDLRACELVTLSGCETGLALSGGGDEQLGLGRAFLSAGARALVMSLWPVEDTATDELMRIFYHHLMRGESKIQALQTAQRALIHGTNPAYTHPYYWAAFRLVGAPGPLSSLESGDASLLYSALL